MSQEFDREALREKYRRERGKRLRSDGADQYTRLAGVSGEPLGDPYTPVTPRKPKTDHVTFAFIGGGWGGLLAGARLKEAGISDVRLIDKAGGFGGAWYWNRYPGAQCDTASMIYMPLLEETEHVPSEKYAHGPEILEHAQRIARHYGLYDNALLHTSVTSVDWQAEGHRWRIRTHQGDDFTAQFVGMGLAGLHVPKLPGIAGLELFSGHSFHTSRWDYAYTGGDPQGAALSGLADKRVAIIGTGATAVQCIPHLASSCKALHVFQRTPSSVDERNNAPIDSNWFEKVATPGWQQRFLENFAANQTGLGAENDLVEDGWTEIAARIRSRIMAVPANKRSPETMLAAFEDADFEKMEGIRARVDRIVDNPETAKALKAWYRQLCKRPCFHDAYLQAFNRPNVTLVDTDGKGVERIDAAGLVVAGKHYPVDCIIFASGFEVSDDHVGRMGYELRGRGGLPLSKHWQDGMHTLHGVHMHGFPNAFLAQPIQGANLISNIPHNLVEASQTIAAVVKHATDSGASEVEAEKSAEDAWVDLLLSGPGRIMGTQDCTPGYYNNEGIDPGPAARLFTGYPAGALAFFHFIQAWRSKGDFAGLEFRRF